MSVKKYPRCATNTTGVPCDVTQSGKNYLSGECVGALEPDDRQKEGDSVSVKIKVSYQETDELDRVLQLLRPVIKSYRISGNQAGSFRKAYIDLRDEHRPKPERTPGTAEEARGNHEKRG